MYIPPSLAYISPFELAVNEPHVGTRVLYSRNTARNLYAANGGAMYISFFGQIGAGAAATNFTAHDFGVTISDSTFTNCAASIAGVAWFYVARATPGGFVQFASINNTYINNIAGYTGSVHYIVLQSDSPIAMHVTIDSDTYIGNVVLSDGEAPFNVLGTNIRGGTIYYEALPDAAVVPAPAPQYYANRSEAIPIVYAAWSKSSMMVVRNSRFVNNSVNCVACSGGAIQTQHIDLVIDHSEFINNYAEFFGGALFTGSGSGGLMVHGSLFVNNTSAVRGHHIYLTSGDGVLIRDTTIVTNVSSGSFLRTWSLVWIVRVFVFAYPLLLSDFMNCRGTKRWFNEHDRSFRSTHLHSGHANCK